MKPGPPPCLCQASWGDSRAERGTATAGSHLSLQPTPPQEPEPREGEESSWGPSSPPHDKSTLQPRGHPGPSLPLSARPAHQCTQPEGCGTAGLRSLGGSLWPRVGKAACWFLPAPWARAAVGVLEGGDSSSDSPAQELPSKNVPALPTTRLSVPKQPQIICGQGRSVPAREQGSLEREWP